MHNSIIRPAEARDAAEIARLTRMLGYPVEMGVLSLRLQRLLGSASDAVFVAETGPDALQGWIHGFLSQLIESEYRVEIGGLIVDEKARRCGIGRDLVLAVESWAQEQGVKEVSVRCREERHDSHLFYARLGFSHTKTQRVFRKRWDKHT